MFWTSDKKTMLENTCWSEGQKNVVKASEFTEISVSDAIYPWHALEHTHYKTAKVR